MGKELEKTGLSEIETLSFKVKKAKDLLRNGHFSEAKKLFELLRIDISANDPLYFEMLFELGVATYLSDNQKAGREIFFQSSLWNTEKMESGLYDIALIFPELKPLADQFRFEQKNADIL